MDVTVNKLQFFGGNMKNNIKKKLKNIFMFSLISCLPITSTLLVGCSTTIQDNSNNQDGNINNPSDNPTDNPSNSDNTGDNEQNPPVDSTIPEEPLLPDPVLEKYINLFDKIFNKSSDSTFRNNFDELLSLYLKSDSSKINEDVVNLASTKIQFLDELEKIPGINELIVYNSIYGTQGTNHPINFNNENDRNKIVTKDDISYKSMNLNDNGQITFNINVDLGSQNSKFFPTVRQRGTSNPNPWTQNVNSNVIDITLDAKYDEFYFLTDPSRSYNGFMDKLSKIDSQILNSKKIFAGIIVENGERKLVFSSYYYNNKKDKINKGKMMFDFHNGMLPGVNNVTLFDDYYFELSLI